MIVWRIALFVSLAPLLRAADPTPEQIEFFEKRIRPVLARACYQCHSTAVASPMGDLRVDSRDALFQGGKLGPAIRPDDPERSLLLQAVSHKEKLKMPPSGKLPDNEIADLTAWVKMGAPYPHTEAKSYKIGRASCRERVE